MGMTTYLSSRLLRHVLTNTAYSPPARVYLALFTTAPDAKGENGTEVNGTAYARVPVTFNVTAGDPSYGVLSGTVEFPSAGSSWGTVTSGGLFDAATGGNLLSIDSFVDPGNPGVPLPKTIATGDTLRVTQNNLRITLGGPAA